MLTREKLNSRKLAFAVLTEFITTLLLIAGNISGSDWVQVTLMASGSYIASQGYVDGRTSRTRSRGRTQ